MPYYARKITPAKIVLLEMQDGDVAAPQIGDLYSDDDGFRGYILTVIQVTNTKWDEFLKDSKRQWFRPERY